MATAVANFFRKSMAKLAKASPKSFNYRPYVSISTLHDRKLNIFTKPTTALRYRFVTSLVNSKTFSSSASTSENTMNGQLVEAFMDPITHEKVIEGLNLLGVLGGTVLGVVGCVSFTSMMVAKLLSKYTFVELQPPLIGKELKVDNVRKFFRSFQGEYMRNLFVYSFLDGCLFFTPIYDPTLKEACVLMFFTKTFVLAIDASRMNEQYRAPEVIDTILEGVEKLYSDDHLEQFQVVVNSDYAIHVMLRNHRFTNTPFVNVIGSLLMVTEVVGGKSFRCNIPLLPYDGPNAAGQLKNGELHVIIPLLEKGGKGKFGFEVLIETDKA